MFGKKVVENIKLEENVVDCLISAATKVEGNVTFTGGLRIDGAVYGDVIVPEGERGTVVISESARVEGKVQVTDAIINGTIRGSLVASSGLQLEPSARIEGDITYKTLEMFPGAIVSGKLIHVEGDAQPVQSLPAPDAEKSDENQG